MMTDAAGCSTGETGLPQHKVFGLSGGGGKVGGGGSLLELQRGMGFCICHGDSVQQDLGLRCQSFVDSHERRLLLARAAMMRLRAGLSSPDTKLAPSLRRFRVVGPPTPTLSTLLTKLKVRPARLTGRTWKMSLGSSSPCMPCLAM